jgi:pimeloyl-ACP methyl ester carboxylesterase
VREELSSAIGLQDQLGEEKLCAPDVKILPSIRKYGRYHRPIARPRLFWLNRDSQFNEEIEMKLSQMYRAALVATAMLILSSGLHMRGFAQTNSPQGAKNIVLVHGAWADGSCWSKVIALLQEKGLHVVAVQNPLTSLADDVAATKRIITLQEGPVILVGIPTRAW